MSKNESLVEFLVVLSSISIVLSRIFKRKIEGYGDNWFITIFIALAVTIFLSLFFPELRHWEHFSAQNYEDEDHPGW